MNKKSNVVERLRQLILSGELQPGQKLASGVELANRFGVAHLTMRRALRELELSGDITIIHGRGIFVSERHTEKRKFLIVRPGMAESAVPAHYLLPYFLQRCNELGVEVDEADLIFKTRFHFSAKQFGVLKVKQRNHVFITLHAVFFEQRQMLF